MEEVLPPLLQEYVYPGVPPAAVTDAEPPVVQVASVLEQEALTAEGCVTVNEHVAEQE